MPQSPQERVRKRAQRAEFDRLRANGEPIGIAAHQARISHTTAWRWDRDRVAAQVAVKDEFHAPDQRSAGQDDAPDGASAAAMHPHAWERDSDVDEFGDIEDEEASDEEVLSDPALLECAGYVLQHQDEFSAETVARAERWVALHVSRASSGCM